ncbi:MAG TPA: YciI family protein [Candidatus Limnocylindria bacterium]|nr:YciI family protein [Candidatus Limnocylindria bacterium]
MQYMVLIASTPEGWHGFSDDERRALYPRLEAWWAEHAAAGRIVEGHQLQGVETATTVRIAPDGEVTVTDGPFAEAKEIVGGYAVIDVPDLDAAIAMWRTWPSPDLCEIRPLVSGDERPGM